LLTALAAAPTTSAQDILSRLKVGALAHDVPIVGDQSEHGADITANAGPDNLGVRHGVAF
jgi:hypothetical protein